VCPGSHQVLLAQQSDTHRVDQRVAGVAGCEADLAPDRGDADAVAVVTDSPNHSGEQVSIPRQVERPEPEAVEHGDWSSAHGEHVPQNSPDAGGCSLIWLDRRRMIM
jgi:hypothetical protein